VLNLTQFNAAGGQNFCRDALWGRDESDGHVDDNES
jgi:hypothetical protein